jgi:lipid II:glycine glycyltransferase (peptidoglycan interpeptide bridge formation enzyme)
MWGAPDEFHKGDPMWGVYRFKDGFGGRVARHIGAWDLPLQPPIYRLYTGVLPRVLGLMRIRARAGQSIRGDI